MLILVNVALEVKSKDGGGEHVLIIQGLPERRGVEGRECLEAKTHDA